jgi:hypothetical protein
MTFAPANRSSSIQRLPKESLRGVLEVRSQERLREARPRLPVHRGTRECGVLCLTGLHSRDKPPQRSQLAELGPSSLFVATFEPRGLGLAVHSSPPTSLVSDASTSTTPRTVGLPHIAQLGAWSGDIPLGGVSR